MKKIIIWALILVLCGVGLLLTRKKITQIIIPTCRSIWVKAQHYPFQDTTLSIDERVEDLLSRLTLDQKLNMMQHSNPAIPSLGLPAYSWWNEART